MPAWLSALQKIFWVLIKLYFVFLVFCMIALVFILVTAIGERTLVNDTIHLAPGESKSYYLPPGMVYLHVSSDVPINERTDGLTGNSFSNGMTGDNSARGNPFGINVAYFNPGETEATMNVHFGTGVLNPFGYALYGI
jgi:hypothetical protein